MFGRRSKPFSDPEPLVMSGNPSLDQDVARYAAMPAPTQQIAAMAGQDPAYTPRARTLSDKLGLLSDAFRGTDVHRRALAEQDELGFQQWQAQQAPNAKFTEWQRQKEWERANPAPVNNDTVADYNFRVQTLGKAAADEWLKSASDPVVNVTLPGNRFYSGPRSGLAQALGGASGGAAAPTAPVGKLKPIGGATPRASGGFPIR